MKKLILLALAAVMVLSMIPAMAFSAYADDEVTYPDPSEDFWSVWRDADDYAVEEGEPCRPAAGYEYTSEGFKVISPVFGEYTAKTNVSTSRPVDLKEGFYMEIRVDDFSYAGNSGTEDEWIAFSIADRPVTSPASSNSNHWCCLLRGAGNGKFHRGDAIGSFKNTAKVDTTPGSFLPLGSFDAEAYKNGVVVKDGIEYYTFEVSYNGSEYTIKVNGVALGGATGLTEFINSMESTYILLTLHSGQKGGKSDVTITKQGTSEADAEVPSGNDEREPEDNLLVYGDPIDPNTIEANKPAVIFDANKSSFKKDPSGSNITLTPTGSGAYHVQASGEIPYFVWSIKPEITHMAADFPVFVMMLKDFVGNDGGAYFCAGDVVSATDTYKVDWSQWDESATFYGEKENYTHIVVDLSTLIADNETLQGRLHNIRPHFGVDPADEEMSQWNIEYMAFFRSVEEANAYAAWYNENVIVPAEEADTSEDQETETEPEDETEAETKGETEAETKGETEAETKADETKADETKADETKGDDAADDGCASVVGFGAVAVLAVAAAAVVLKKKD